MKILDFHERKFQREIMDDFDLQGPVLERTLQDLDKVNRWLGGNKVSLEGLEKLNLKQKSDQPIKILDVGCGNGTLLKEVARWGRRNNLVLDLEGVDANPHTIEIATANCRDFPEIHFHAQDVFSSEFQSRSVDIVLCTLTLHHFTDQEIEQLMQDFVRIASKGVVINDLQRSKIAFVLFKAFCSVFIQNRIAREDGFTSILRSFRRKDLEKYGKGLPVEHQEIEWKWAFRYQWILHK